MSDNLIEILAVPGDSGDAAPAATSIRDRIARILRSTYYGNAVWSAIGMGVGQALQFLGAVLAARVLGPRHYGEFGMVQSAVNTLTVFAALGLGVTATTHVARWRGTENHRAASVIAFCTLVAATTGGLFGIIVFFTADKLAAGWLHAPQLTPDLRIAAVVLFFTALNSSQSGIIAGFEAFKQFAWGNSLRGAAGCIGIVVGAYTGGVPGAIIGTLAAAILGTLVFNKIIRMQCKLAGIRLKITSALLEGPSLLGFTLPVLFSGLTMAPAVWLANSFVVRQSDFRQLGLFQVATHWQMMILFISGCLSSVALPRMAQFATVKTREFNRLVHLNYLLMGGSAGICAIAVIAGAKLICRLYGPQYQAAASVLAVLAVSAVIAAVNTVPGNVVWALGAVRVGAILNLVPATALVIASWFLAHHGARGLAASWVIAESIHMCVTVPYVWFVLSRRSRALVNTPDLVPAS